MLRVTFDEMFNQFRRVLVKMGASQERAELCAWIFAENSRDGVYSHGLNSFPRFIDYIKNNIIHLNMEPKIISSFGNFEQWDGGCGIGILNAHFCMNRAISLAKKNVIGCVGLRNTNHWMRGGTYGLQAIDTGCIGICWTNTIPNMPPWGAAENRIGNNPLVIAIPGPEGPILFDMAMSQFSFGKIDSYQMHKENLPVFGGYDKNGNLSTDPKAIIESGRALPIGFWKGSGLAIMLDLLASIISGGNSTCEIAKFSCEYNVSQVFIAIDPSKVSSSNFINKTIEETMSFIHNSKPVNHGEPPCYPGEQMLKRRKENMEKGIPAEEIYWQQVLKM